MEFISGPSCEQLVASGFGLPKSQVWQIVRQVASGLLHAFRQGLIHRDIKPANLLLMPAPEGAPKAVPFEWLCMERITRMVLSRLATAMLFPVFSSRIFS